MNENQKDKHLNIYYSYDTGNIRDPFKTQQLENNITRCFLSTLSNLNISNQNEIIKEMTNSLIDTSTNTKVLFDLQNLKDRSNIYNMDNKIVLMISSFSEDVDGSSIIKYKKDYEVIKSFDKLEEGQKSYIRKSLLGKLKHYLDTGRIENNRIQTNGFTIELSNDNIQEYYNLVHKCQPDGWIIGDNFVILIESKVGCNNIDKRQIFRHIRGENGLNESVKKVKLITKSWSQIIALFDNISNYNKTERFICEQFMEVMKMNNVEFDPLKNRESTEGRQIQLEQLVKYLVDKISKEPVLKEYSSLLKKEKKYAGYIGFQIGKSDTAHYNVHFNSPDHLGINLTLYGVELDNNKNDEELIKFITKKTNISIPDGRKVSQEQAKLMRYFISFVGYRNILKNQRGVSIDTLQCRLNFYELAINKKGKKQKLEFLDDMFELYKKTKTSGSSKQIDLEYKIQIFDGMDKKLEDNDIRKLNNDVLKEPSGKLIDCFVDFIQETINIAIHFGLQNI